MCSVIASLYYPHLLRNFVVTKVIYKEIVTTHNVKSNMGKN